MFRVVAGLSVSIVPACSSEADPSAGDGGRAGGAGAGSSATNGTSGDGGASNVDLPEAEELVWQGPMLIDEGAPRSSSPRIFLDAEDGVWFVMLREVSNAHEVHARRYDLATRQWSEDSRPQRPEQ